ncbi:hypothetical protein BJ878DRAFT_480453 [Calycina marina]|uniref:Uncharacterized protein n=1 Tax=Calycina marina TaxID=1763456 RepID=A0A9P7Z236_9HELO|nr:hypothetical protein BJ878DRAFT_480453 [Calycina marina]
MDAMHGVEELYRRTYSGGRQGGGIAGAVAPQRLPKLQTSLSVRRITGSVVVVGESAKVGRGILLCYCRGSSVFLLLYKPEVPLLEPHEGMINTSDLSNDCSAFRRKGILAT